VQFDSGDFRKLKPENLEVVAFDAVPTADSKPSRGGAIGSNAKVHRTEDLSGGSAASTAPRERSRSPRQQQEQPLLQGLRGRLQMQSSLPPTWVRELNLTPVEHSGAAPRGAGVIAFRECIDGSIDWSGLYVCLVEKAPKWKCSKCGLQLYDTWWECTKCGHPRSPGFPRFLPGQGRQGPHGFPKGGQEPQDQRCVVTNALREWEEETGIPCGLEEVHLTSRPTRRIHGPLQRRTEAVPLMVVR